MTRYAGFVSTFAVSLWFAVVPIASAQDVMELDLAFKNGQLPTSGARQEQPDLRERVRNGRPAVASKRRHRRPHGR